jgi:hypothetical protein
MVGALRMAYSAGKIVFSRLHLGDLGSGLSFAPSLSLPQSDYRAAEKVSRRNHLESDSRRAFMSSIYAVTFMLMILIHVVVYTLSDSC